MEHECSKDQLQGQMVEHVDLRHLLELGVLRNREEHTGNDGGPDQECPGGSHAFESTYSGEQGKDNLH